MIQLKFLNVMHDGAHALMIDATNVSCCMYDEAHVFAVMHDIAQVS